MTPTERIQLIQELGRAFPSHRRLQEALVDYQALAIEANRAKPAVVAKAKPKATNSRAEYMRAHRAKERELIRTARRQKEKLE
jgi:hypothetical protein